MFSFSRRLLSTLRPNLSKSKENYILKKYNFKCAGPNKDANLAYTCPLHLNDMDLNESVLFGKIYQIDHILERNESNYDDSLVETIDDLDNLQPLCLFCHNQKTVIYNSLKKDRSLLKTNVGELWKFFRGDKEKILYGERYD